PLALRTGEVATPEALVATVFDPPKLPPAPLPPGTIRNVTLAPLTGLPNWSLTVATRGFAKAVLVCAVWPPPLVAIMMPAPGVLVSEKFADAPSADATTV